MTIQQIKQDIAKLKEAIKVKKALPWDCKSLMSRYQDEISRREILCKLYDFIGVAYEALGPYRLEVENQKGLSREAREFLSLSAEKQADAVNNHYPSKQCTEKDEEENNMRLEEMIKKIGGFEEFEHRLTRGCKFMGVEPLNIRLNPENSSV